MQTMSKAPISLTVNGERHELLVSPTFTLLEVIRDELGLTGAKRGCEDGTCGTCTVIVNGSMARACRVPLDRADGKEVLTIEGMGSPEKLHPLQEAFIEVDAVQCGFCTPGMIMASKALLDRNDSPDREQIARALGSNLCRCTGYAGILDAVQLVSTPNKSGEALGPNAQWGVQQRADAQDKALGISKYAADLTMPNMLHGAILRSPHNHADIVAVDVTDAEALPGVIVVVTSKDVPGLNRFGRVVKDQPVLADDRVRQIGDAVAAVAAESPEIAAEAVSLIRVDYRPIPEVLDPADALKEGAPIVHGETNLLAEKEIKWGDIEEGLAKADFVFEETYTTPWCEHGYLEPEAVLAFQNEDGVVTIRGATQHSFLHQATVAETMDLPKERVRIIPTVIGGAFGGKTDLSCQPVAALLAMKTGRPVKIVYGRAESLASTTKRHPMEIRCRTGVTKEGKLTALHAEMLADTGAYASAGPGLYIRAGVSIEGPYQWPNAYIHGKVVYTNNTLAGAMRGFGAPQVAFAIEAQMDGMAAELGIDPLEFRLMNRRVTDASEATPMDLQQEDAYEKTVEAVRPYYTEALRSRPSRSEENGRYRRGIGLASMRYGVGASGRAQAPGRVTIELGLDGGLKLLTGAVDLGQGSDTALCIIAAGELSQPVTSIAIVTGDTEITPDAGSSTGSRLVYYVGNAAKDSAIQLRDAVLSTASDLLEIPSDELRLEEGRVTSMNGNGTSALSATLAEVALARQSARQPLRFDGVFDPTSLIYDAETGIEKPYAVYVTATHLAEVEVDMERGNVKVLRIVAAHDVGWAVYPLGLKGQIDGAVAMGVGLALKEEYVPGETVGFKQYRMPTARDMPEVTMLLVETGDPSAGLGAKGVAECATVAVAPAIINAVADAIGTHPTVLPVTPARLMNLIGGTVR